MGILGHLLGGGISAGAGGVFGLIGNLATKTFGYLEAKQSLLVKQSEWAHETELLKLQAQWKQPETESPPPFMGSPPVYGGSTAEGGEGGIALPAPPPPRFAWSSSPASGGGAWVDAARALVRPLLTLGLSAVLAAAFFSMAPSDSARAYVIDSLVFAAVTAIVWWFGDRASPRRR